MVGVASTILLFQENLAIENEKDSYFARIYVYISRENERCSLLNFLEK